MEATSPIACDARDEAVLLEYVVHLMRRRPVRGAVVGFAALLAGCVGLFLLGSPLFALVGIAVIVGSASEFVFPIRYCLTTRRVKVAYGIARLEMEWERVRRVTTGPGGLRLSPFAEETRLDGFRGVTLRAEPEGQPGDLQSLLAIVREHAPEARIDG